jgi:dTMP kinase
MRRRGASGWRFVSGCLITIEGVEGAGKSTQAPRLAAELERDGHAVLVTREPGGTDLGRALRQLLLDGGPPGPTAETELLLYLADRAEHVRRVIEPAIAGGAIVIADRFSDSTLAYQGYGRGLPLERVRQLDEFARGGLEARLTFVLDLAPEEGLRRARRLGPADRIEREAIDFHRRVRSGFHALAEAAPSRVVVVDAAQPVDEVARLLALETRARLGGAS